jgi:hypothetical protein
LADEMRCFDEFRDALRLTLRLVSKEGERIDVGDEFRVRLTVVNEAPAPGLGTPRVAFRNTRVVVTESQAARPVLAPSLWLDLPEPYLVPGESSAVEVAFVARRTICSLTDFVGGLDDVVEAFVTADLDQDAFFQVWARSETTSRRLAP